MKNYTVRPYKLDDFAVWNAFIGKAKNATFLFHRDFMDYHNDRFDDYSLLVFEEDKLVSILPANRVESQLFSHQGLTYGGFVFGEMIKLGQVLFVVQSVMQFLHEQEIKTLQLKLTPTIYHEFFSEEIMYTLFLAEARLSRRDCLSVIDLTKPFSFSKDRKQGVARGGKSVLTVKEETNFDLFWNEILIPNLDKKHQAKPVHSVNEIKLLHQKFSKNIRQFNVYHEGEIVAGTTIFETKHVAHSQYISGNDKKNQLGSLDFLHNYLLTDIFKDKHYFDFGISHEVSGRNVNQGLLYWKESFGAKTVVQDFYEIQTGNHPLLENILL